MSGTVLENPLVQFYLRRLDAACLTLPLARTRELRDQIAAHLDEALPPGATDAQVRAELARLGTPAALAAEAAGPAPRSAGARLRSTLARVRGWVWVSIATVLALLATAAAYVTVVSTAEPLSETGSADWFYPQDRARSSETNIGSLYQFTVPQRFRQQTGFVVGLNNASDRTVTVLGIGPDVNAAWLHMSVEAGVGYDATQADFTDATRFTLPVAIAPHSATVIRVLYTPPFCLQPGFHWSIGSVPVLVRVGFFTRTEYIPLSTIWNLKGPKVPIPAGCP